MSADEIVTCGDSRQQAKAKLERWRYALERKEMKVSTSKTEYMFMNEKGNSGTVRLQGAEVVKVDEFKYLGSTVQVMESVGVSVERECRQSGVGREK